jgi:hypothetical protein
MFKYFNPLWLIQNLLQPSINPITIGAGVGAVGSAVTGKSPIKGALLGGALGGMGQAAGLFGATGATTEAAKQATGASLFSSPEPLAGGGVGNLGMFTNPQATSVMGGVGDVSGLGVSGTYAQNIADLTKTGPTSMFDAGRSSTLGYDPTFLGGQGPATFAGGGGYDPSLLGSVQRGLSSGYETLADWTKANPMQALSTTGQALTSGQQEQAQQMMQPQALPVTKGTYNVAPSPITQPGDKVSSKMQVTPNQLQVYPNFYFRGGY